MLFRAGPSMYPSANNFEVNSHGSSLARTTIHSPKNLFAGDTSCTARGHVHVNMFDVLEHLGTPETIFRVILLAP